MSSPRRPTWMIWALHATGAPLLWIFIVPELAWGIAQWLPVVPVTAGWAMVAYLETRLRA